MLSNEFISEVLRSDILDVNEVGEAQRGEETVMENKMLAVPNK